MEYQIVQKRFKLTEEEFDKMVFLMDLSRTNNEMYERGFGVLQPAEVAALDDFRKRLYDSIRERIGVISPVIEPTEDCSEVIVTMVVEKDD